MPTIAPFAWISIALAAGYAFGGLSPGWWLARRAGVGDLRTQGSRSTGATNVGRVLGDRFFLLVLVLDAAKGALVVIAARSLGPAYPWTLLALPAAVAGHIWSIWLGFRGGRGAATLLGGCIALSPLLALAAVSAGFVVLAPTRNRFIAGATAFATSLACLCWLIPAIPARIAYLLASALVLLAHRESLSKYFAS